MKKISSVMMKKQIVKNKIGMTKKITQKKEEKKEKKKMVTVESES